MILIFSALIFLITREKEQFLSKKSEGELTTRDSIRKEEDNLRALNIAKELGKAGFEIDSLTLEVKKLKGQVSKPAPLLTPSASFDLVLKSLKNDSLKCEIRVKSNEARSNLFNLTYDGAFNSNNKWSTLAKNQLITNSMSIEKNETVHFPIWLYQNPFATSLLALRVRGYYQGDDKIKRQIDEYLIYDVKEGKGGRAIGVYFEELRNIFKN